MASKVQNRFEGKGAWQWAQHKARYAHKDHVVFEKNGQPIAAVANADTLKEALLASGTQGRFVLLHSNGVGMSIGWSIGINVMRQFSKGWR